VLKAQNRKVRWLVVGRIFINVMNLNR